MEKIYLGKSVNPGTYRQDYYSITVWNRYNVAKHYNYFPNNDVGKIEQLIGKFSLVEYDYFYEDFHKFLNTSEKINIYLDDNGIFAEDYNGAIYRMLDYEFWFEAISELWKWGAVEHVPPNTPGLGQQRPPEIFEARVEGLGKIWIKEIELPRDTDFPIPPLPESRIEKYMRLYGEYIIKRNMLQKMIQNQMLNKGYDIKIVEDKVEEEINLNGSRIKIFKSCSWKCFIYKISNPIQDSDVKMRYYVGYIGDDTNV